MSNYEIMLILDPKADIKLVEKIANEVFGEDQKKITKMDRTELAYKINNSTTATYVLINVKTTSANIKEFVRKSNILKTIWRNMIVNVDAEAGVKRPRKVYRRRFDLNQMSNSTHNRKSKNIKEVKKTIRES